MANVKEVIQKGMEGAAVTAAADATGLTGAISGWFSGIINSAPVSGFITSGPVTAVTGAISTAATWSWGYISAAAVNSWGAITSVASAPAIQGGFSAVTAAVAPYWVAAVAAVAAIGAFAWWKSSGSSEPQAPAVDARARAQELALARQQSINAAGIANEVSTGHSAALEQQRAAMQQQGARV